MVSANPITSSCHRRILIRIFVASPLCHHPLRRARPRSVLDTQGSHRVLQHRTVVRSQSCLAVPLERHHSVSPEGCGMLRDECLGHDCEWCCHGCPSALHFQSSIAESVQIVAFSGGVGMRLLGISIASFSSGPFNAPSSRLRLKMTMT